MLVTGELVIFTLNLSSFKEIEVVGYGSVGSGEDQKTICKLSH